VNEWEKKLQSLDEYNIEPHLSKTFVQYRIINILHETWKTVWTQFSPYARSFDASRIQTMHSFDVAEGYLNRLYSWRRMLDNDSWRRIQHAFSEKKKQVSWKHSFLGPPRLPSGENPEAWTYLARQPLEPITLKRENKHMHKFRLEFVNAMVKENVYKNHELERLLGMLITRYEQKEENFPSSQIQNKIRSEFLA
jgi:hypothetical protein